MLDSVDQIELSRRQRPREGRSGEVAAALRALAFAASEEDAEVAYHRVLFAVGNNHRGSYFPIVLDAIPFLGEVLGGGTRFGRARALDVLIDLISSFEPDPEILVQEGLRPDELPGMLHGRVLRPENARAKLVELKEDGARAVAGLVAVVAGEALVAEPPVS